MCYYLDGERNPSANEACNSTRNESVETRFACTARAKGVNRTKTFLLIRKRVRGVASKRQVTAIRGCGGWRNYGVAKSHSWLRDVVLSTLRVFNLHHATS